jgi:hypothetical protein
MKVKVLGEKFRVYPEGKRIHNATHASGEYVRARPAAHEDYEEPGVALCRAYVIAGTLGCDVMVDRVTIHEPIPEPDPESFNFTAAIRAGETETVTASYTHSIPHFASSPLSRYSPVNGWEVPKEIEI